MPRQTAVEARKFAAVLAEGAAHAAGPDENLEVRLLTLPASIRSWAGRQATLMNHITVGAYAMVKQTDGSRWLYTTTRGRTQVLTLGRWTKQPIDVFTSSRYERLRADLEASLLKAMRHATTDGRSRRATARGFDINAAQVERRTHDHFRRIAEGSESLDQRDLDAFLEWWDTQVEPAVKRMAGGVPVDPAIYAMAERAGLTTRWNLTRIR